MARDQRPMNDDEIAELRDKMDAQREDIRAALAEDLGGDLEDYRVLTVESEGGYDVPFSR